MRKQFTQHTSPHREMINQYKPKVHDAQAVLDAMATLGRDVCWLTSGFMSPLKVELVFMSFFFYTL